MGKPVSVEELHGAQQTEGRPAQDSSYDTDKDYDQGSFFSRLKHKAKMAGREIVQQAKKSGPVDAVLGETAQGIGEGALATATGLPAAAAGGLLGAGRAALGSASGLISRKGESVDEALNAGAEVSTKTQKLGFQPRHASGELVSELLASPLTLASEYGGKLAGAVGNAVGGGQGEAVGRTLGEVAPAAAASLYGLKGAKPAATGFNHGQPTPPPAAVGQAQQLATTMGFDFNKLTADVKKRLTDVVQEATASGTPVDPAAMKRQFNLESLPVPITKATKGQLTRDPGQRQLESTLQFSESGKPIRNVFMDQDKTLADNLEYLRGSTKGGKDLDERGVGQSLFDSVGRAEKQSKRKVDEAYDKVRKSPEINDPVSPKPLIDWLTKNGAAAISVPEIKSIAEALKKFGAVGTGKRSGKAVAGRDLTIGEMEEVRKLATQLRNKEGPASHYMGEAVRVIDQALDKSGGNLYKEARQARTEHGLAFEDPNSVYQITAMKSRTDRQVALEDVWRKTVIGNNTDGLLQVRDRLLKDKDVGVREQGRRTWRDMQSYTIDWLKEQATGGLAKNERGESQFSVEKFNKALKSIGTDNLTALLGEGKVKKLNQIRDVAADLKTTAASAGGSDTAPRLLRMLENLSTATSMIPGGHTAGMVARGAVHAVGKLHRAGQNTKDVDKALNYTATPQYDLAGRINTRNKVRAAGALDVAATQQEENR